MWSVVRSSHNSSESLNHMYISSSGTGDSGCGHMKPHEIDIPSTEYIPLQIHSSRVPDYSRDKYYSYNEAKLQQDSGTENTQYHRSTESDLLLGQREDPISEESAYVSDTGSQDRSQLPSANCEEHQPLVSCEEREPLVTQAHHKAHESDDSSIDDLHYSVEDISTVLDQSGSTVPDYVFSTCTSHSICNSKMSKSVVNNCPFNEKGGYVSMGTDS